MSFEEQFDDLIRQKAGEAEYGFDQANWEKAAKMLDAEKAVAIRTGYSKMYIGLAVIGVTTLSVLGLYYFNQPSQNTANNGAQLSSQDAPAITPPEISANTANTNPVQLTSSSGVTAPADELADNSAQAGLNKGPVSHSKEKAVSPRFKTETIYRVVTSSDPDSKDGKKPNAESASGQEPDQNEARADQITNAKPLEANPAQNEFNPAMPNTALVNEVQDDQNVSKDKDILPADENVFNAASRMNKELELEYLMPQWPSLEAQEMKYTQFPIVLHPVKNEYYYHRYNTFALSLEGGAMYNLGWQTNAGKDGEGFNAYGGVNAMWYVSRKLGFGGGLQFYNLANTKQAFYSATKIEYGFGSVNSGTVLTSNNLVYISVPLKLQYAINSYNRLGFGLSTSVLVDARSSQQTYTILDGVKIYDKAAEKKGIYDNQSLYNFALHASYGVKFTKRIWLNSEFMYGLTDIFSNSAQVANREKPLGIRLGLVYTLIEK